MRSFIIAASAAAAFALDMSLPALDDAMIAKINAEGSWEAARNDKFENATLADAMALCGTILAGPLKAKRQGKLGKSDLKPLPLSALPTSFDARTAWPACAPTIGHIRDQSACGSCWAFGSTEALNDRMCIAHNYTGELSAGDTNACCNSDHGCGGSDGCNGGIPEEAWSYFKTTGVVTGGDAGSDASTCYPYPFAACAHHEPSPAFPACPSTEYNTPSCPADNGKGCQKGFAGKWATDKHYGKSAYTLSTIEQVQTDIMQYGSVTAAFTVYSDFLTYKSGVYTHISGAALGGHAVKIVGWGVDSATKTPYWTVANSWNDSWGAKGFFMIKRGVNECGIEADICAGNV